MKILLAAVIGVLALLGSLLASDTPISYNLKLNIEPGQGSVAVQGGVEVPLGSPGARDFKFNLHETFAISRLLVNGKAARFSFTAADRPPMTPTSKRISWRTGRICLESGLIPKGDCQEERCNETP